ncbi:hypothetical protein N7447_006872 [Penicillium robsamsonii]|uniref:uncharacterized protein n=1 Tax=Penicillium robsamsonii TaxID=1792511 RepID=UPI00254681D5|nr:uncharacterized protein N7447_006872 [Penicillium robsamsonii]KAJ5824532.1 hypothetical protein N7447_006872 [Penicillium robsamsonii]
MRHIKKASDPQKAPDPAAHSDPVEQSTNVLVVHESSAFAALWVVGLSYPPTPTAALNPLEIRAVASYLD